MVNWLHRPASAPGVPASPQGTPRDQPGAEGCSGRRPERQFEEEDLVCSICRDFLTDAVVLTETGKAYDSHCIRLWFLMGGNTCPLSGVRLQSKETARAPEDLIRAAAAAAASTSGQDGDGCRAGDPMEEGDWWTPVINAMPGNGKSAGEKGGGGGGSGGGKGTTRRGNWDHVTSLKGIIKRRWMAARRSRSKGDGDGAAPPSSAPAPSSSSPAQPLQQPQTRQPQQQNYYGFFGVPPSSTSTAAVYASAIARPKSAAPATGGPEEKRWWWGEHEF